MTGCGMGWSWGGIWCTLAVRLSGNNHGRGERDEEREGGREGEKDEGLRSGHGKSPAKVKGKEFRQRINVSVLFK